MTASKDNFEGTLQVTLGGTVAQGGFAVILGVLGMYMKGGDSGDLVPFLTQGKVKAAPKTTSESWTKFMPLFYDTSTSKFTKVHKFGGVRAFAAADADSADTTGDIILVPNAGGGLITKAAQHTTVAAVDTIVTGLNVVVGAVATLDSDPGDDPEMVSASIGDQAGAPAAGSIYIKSWKNGGTDPTPAAATTFSKKVNYIAWGY